MTVYHVAISAEIVHVCVNVRPLTDTNRCQCYTSTQPRKVGSFILENTYETLFQSAAGPRRHAEEAGNHTAK